MRRILLYWIWRHIYCYDPKVEEFLAEKAESYGLKKSDYTAVINKMTVDELSDFRHILEDCTESEEDDENDDCCLKKQPKLSEDKRAKKLWEQVKVRQEDLRKLNKKQKFLCLDWDNLILNQEAFKLICKKSEMGVYGKFKISIAPNQINGFPTHLLHFSLAVTVDGEEILLDNEEHDCKLIVYTDENETKWLKKCRQIVSFNPFSVEPPEELFKDDYYQQKYDIPLSLPLDTTQRIKDFLCGDDNEIPEKAQFENPTLIKPILWVLVFNHLLEKKLALDRVHVLEEIKKNHLKEKMYFRLLNYYSLSKEKRAKLQRLYFANKKKLST